MAVYNDTVGKCGLKAASTITAKRLIELTTFPSVQHTSAQTDMPCGQALADAATGEAVEYSDVGGFATCVASDAITALAEICADAAGKVHAAEAADFVIGYACEAAAADGDEIRCFLFTSGWVHA